MSPPLHITHNYGDGFVAARVAGRTCILSATLALQLGAAIPVRVVPEPVRQSRYWGPVARKGAR